MAHLISLGCPKNLVDSELIAGNLVTNGFGLSPDEKEADIFIVNTCAFLSDSRKEAESWIKKGASWKSRKAGRVLVVCGCLSQSASAGEYRERYPQVDIWISVDEIRSLAAILESDFKKRKEVSLPAPKPSMLYDHRDGRLLLTPSHYAYLKISDGCDNFCSYCTIPGIRGRLRSRSLESLEKEAASLLSAGVKELILIAQDSSAYGSDLPAPHPGLSDLLDCIERIPGDFKIRLMYLHPAHLTDEVIEKYRSSKKLLKYVEMPIQHISDKILRAMGRRHDSAHLKQILEKMRKLIPGLCIRTSLIVGFPGETDTEFNELLGFVENFQFERLGVFVYSPEEGTSAASLPGRPPRGIAEARKDAIMRAQAKISLQKNRELLGKSVEIVIDEKRGRNFLGRTYMDAPEIDNHARLLCSRKTDISPGDCVKMLVTDASAYEISGKLSM